MLSLEGFFHFLDFNKAFDSVEHPFVFNTLNYFGFGHKFIHSIGVLYNDTNSSATLEHGTCSTFGVSWGVRQGCNSSLLLFIWWWNY